LIIKYSLILAIRNEESTIQLTINSILNNHLKKREYELIIVDGMSTDNTFKILNTIEFKGYNIKILKNPKKIVAAGLNLGIKISKGIYILRLDGHKIYPKNYLSTLTRFIEQNPNVDNVGCIVKTLPFDNTLKAKGICAAVSSKYAIGNSKFRINKINKDIQEVDTVPFGCFKRQIFDEVGLFDESFKKNQDDEFNLRLKQNKKRILLINSLAVIDFARQNFTKLFKMFFNYGYFKPMVWLKHKKIASYRHIVPVVNFIIIFINLILIITKLHINYFFIIIYILFLIITSLIICIENKKFIIFFYVFFSLVIIHNSYAIGNIFFFIRTLFNLKK
jgi:glycosyltransferase involved in cell wall biosynthesis